MRRRITELSQNAASKSRFRLGTVTEIEPHGKRDYEVQTDAMPAKLKTAGRRRYKVVQISRLDADGHKLQGALIIKARDMTAEERQAEGLLRAEEKTAFAEKKAAAKAATNGATTHAAPAPTTATV